MFQSLALALALSHAPATIPFRLEANHIVIEIAIDGKPTRAIFDTGAGNALDPEFAHELGLKLYGHGTVGGVGAGTVSASRTHVDSLEFGSLALADQTFAVLPLPGALRIGGEHPVEALVGREILQRFATRIDYEAHTLTFTPEAEFAYAGTGTAVPLEFRGSTPEVRGSIDGIPGAFQIDTGSSASLILSSPFVAANDLRHKYHIVGNAVAGRGVGGYTHGDLARGHVLMLGPVAVGDPVIDLSTDTGGVFASSRLAGNVGNDVLERFNVTFDYARKVMYLEPNALTISPPPPNRAGMYVQNDDRRFFAVVDVLQNGPAYDAGLRAGDKITAVDGKPAVSMTSNQFWLLMRGPPGETHTLVVERDGAPLTVTLTLRETV